LHELKMVITKMIRIRVFVLVRFKFLLFILRIDFELQLTETEQIQRGNLSQLSGGLCQ
jgi:hypothetical protein